MKRIKFNAIILMLVVLSGCSLEDVTPQSIDNASQTENYDHDKNGQIDYGRDD